MPGLVVAALSTLRGDVGRAEHRESRRALFVGRSCCARTSFPSSSSAEDERHLRLATDFEFATVATAFREATHVATSFMLQNDILRMHRNKSGLPVFAYRLQRHVLLCQAGGAPYSTRPRTGPMDRPAPSGDSRALRARAQRAKLRLSRGESSALLCALLRSAALCCALRFASPGDQGDGARGADRGLDHQGRRPQDDSVGSAGRQDGWKLEGRSCLCRNFIHAANRTWFKRQTTVCKGAAARRKGPFEAPSSLRLLSCRLPVTWEPEVFFLGLTAGHGPTCFACLSRAQARANARARRAGLGLGHEVATP